MLCDFLGIMDNSKSKAGRNGEPCCKKKFVPLLNSLQLNKFPTDSILRRKNLRHKILDRNIVGNCHNLQVGKTILNMTINQKHQKN